MSITKKDCRLSLLNIRLFWLCVSAMIILCFACLCLNLGGGSVLAASKPSRSEIYIQTSFSNNSVDLHFTPVEANSSAKKINSTQYTVKTNNPTGYINYISSIDENTTLNHSESAVSSKIMSTNSDTQFNSLTENTWGFCKNIGGNNLCYPISPLSHPTIYDDTTLGHSSTGFNVTDVYKINFGVRVASSLLPGTYSKTVLMTTVAKEFTLESEFLPGNEFNSIVTNLDPTHKVSAFKRSVTPPQELGRAKIVSTSGSDRPIYAWFDPGDRTVYWWSDADVTYVNGNAVGMFEDFNQNVSDMDLIDIRGMNTSRVYNMSRFFYDGARIVKNYNIDDIDTSNVTDFKEMFASAIPGNTQKSPVDFSKINTVNAITLSGMFCNSSFSSIDVSHFDTKNVVDLSEMFKGVELSAGHIDLRNWDVSRVDRTSGMFEDARIGRVDIGGWDSYSLHNTSNMFRNANISSGLNMVGFDTADVVDMSGMFSFSNIPNLDLAYLNTSNVKSMRSMFEGGRYYSSLDLARFDTRKVEDFSSMFRGVIIDSQTLDVSSFDTSNATSLGLMFDGTNLAGNLDLSNFNTSKVIDMSNMFSSSVLLTNVNLSSFDTRSVIDMHGMFYRTVGMPDIDIRNFNTANVRNMQDMFRETGAVTIKTSNLFNTDFVTSSERMFMGATYLVGENGTGYNTTHPDDKTYARRDTVGQPGYFTF